MFVSALVGTNSLFQLDLDSPLALETWNINLLEVINCFQTEIHPHTGQKEPLGFWCG